MRISKFTNERYADYTKPSNRKKQEQALKNIEVLLGREYPNIIEGRPITSQDKIRSINPSNPEQVVGIFQRGTADDARHAVDAAWRTFATWSRTPAEKRAGYLFKAATIMRKRRHELNAIEILEVGKTWIEADGDIAEAIDFCEFYAREMLRYANLKPAIQLPGEKDELMYIPLGVGAIIPPWNFPLAILTGMTTAAIVAGNTVVLKPSSDSPFIGWMFMEVMKEAGLPPGVVNFLAGPGEAVGDTLVNHPKIRFISFTGSKEVGIRIYEQGAKVQPGQIWLKRIVAEMGGKDSIIVDREADLEEAAQGVVTSAFGFQGQKCSACSRVIVDESIYDRFVDLIAKKAEALTIGPAKDQANYMGPVVNKRSFESIMRYIETGEQQGGRIVAGGRAVGGGGYFIRPTIIADVDRNATISQEEIFGPVLAVIKAKDFNDAIAIANNTQFGLTGAVYSRNTKKLERAKSDFFTGNLYLNRKCTGAMVGAHPFGGFNMSGTDSKAGGQDYLGLFMQAKSVATKIK